MLIISFDTGLDGPVIYMFGTPEQKEKFKTVMADRGQGRAAGGAGGANAPKQEGEKPAGEKK